MKEIIITTQIVEDGKIIDEKIERKSLDDVDSGYTTILFNRDCAAWCKDSAFNLAYLKCQERYLNDLLICRGIIMLNEINDALGVARTKQGCINGLDYTKGDIVDLGLKRYCDLNPEQLMKVEEFELNIKIREDIFNLRFL